MNSLRYVIIGAGFAGAATAYHLARRGVKDILILEQESQAGFHSSGRNAAMARQVLPEPAMAALAREGAAFMRSLPADWPTPPILQQNGSLLLGSGGGWQRLIRTAGAGRQCPNARHSRRRLQEDGHGESESDSGSGGSDDGCR